MDEAKMKGATMATVVRSWHGVGCVIAVILTAALALGGCATRVKVAASDPALAAGLAAVPVIAVGGVAVAPQVGGVLADDDAEAAAAAFHRAFLDARPDLEVWPLPRVQALAGRESLTDLMAEYGRLGRLRPDQLRPLAEPLGACRLLAVARLTADEVRSLSPQGQRPAAAAGSGAADDQGGLALTTVSTERRVTVTLEIFDLLRGSSLWQAEASARKRDRYSYEDRLRRDPGGYIQQRLAAATEPATLERRGEYLQLPDLVDLLEQALAAMMRRLPAAKG